MMKLKKLFSWFFGIRKTGCTSAIKPNQFVLYCFRFSLFFLDEKESLKGITAFVVRLSGCLHTSSITTNGVNTL